MSITYCRCDICGRTMPEVERLISEKNSALEECGRLRSLLLEIFSAALKLHSKKIGLPYFLKIEEAQLDRIRAALGEG